MELDAAKGVTRISKQRPRVLKDVEKLVLVGINERHLAGDTVTENLICEKTKILYVDWQEMEKDLRQTEDCLITLKNKVASIALWDMEKLRVLTLRQVKR